MKADFQAGHRQSEDSIQTKLDGAKVELLATKKDMRAEEAKSQNWLEAQMSSGENVIKGWKDKHETDKLKEHLEKAEQNAEAAISLAETAVAHTVVATYEAINDRMSAEKKVVIAR